MAVFNNCQMHELGRDYTAALVIASVPRVTDAGDITAERYGRKPTSSPVDPAEVGKPLSGALEGNPSSPSLSILTMILIMIYQ